MKTTIHSGAELKNNSPIAKPETRKRDSAQTEATRRDLKHFLSLPSHLAGNPLSPLHEW